MKKSLTSLELAALTNEFQQLVGGKISQIYYLENQFFFQLHTTEGKQFLRIVPGKFLNLTKTKKTSLKPSSFCMQLRKHINNAFIRKIEQKNTERIIIFELESRKLKVFENLKKSKISSSKIERFSMIIELFSPGNLILTDHQNVTIATFQQKRFKDRTVKPKIKYQFPPSLTNWKTLTETGLQKIVKISQKKNLAATLATEIGLGGLYAEEICNIAQINKDQKPPETSPAETKKIIQTIKQVLQQIKKPQGYIYDEQITPILLTDQKPKQKTESYNQAIDTLIPFVVVSPYEKRINTIKRTINRQQEAIAKQEDNIELNNQKAETIYQQYQPLKKLLNIVQELKKTKTWQEIKQELQKEKKIKQIDLKNKKIMVDF
ncbi:hypothetical protein GOV03_04955 [Candidatus Woesearchaeota archaeon]|nr:hypothetical protein [Candidatus Woesearchaeota archaeon]